MINNSLLLSFDDWNVRLTDLVDCKRLKWDVQSSSSVEKVIWRRKKEKKKKKKKCKVFIATRKRYMQKALIPQIS